MGEQSLYTTWLEILNIIEFLVLVHRPLASFNQRLFKMTGDDIHLGIAVT